MFRYAAKVSLLTLSWIPVAITVSEHVGHVGRIQGSSMKPTLNPDSSLGWSDYVFLWKWGLRDNNSMKVGDVVLLRSPTDPEKILIKRVLGVAGDEILTRAPYPKPRCPIPTNHLWVEGDNIHSVDSNNFGPVSTGLVIGKATRIVFPPSRFGPMPTTGGREARIAELKKQAGLGPDATAE